MITAVRRRALATRRSPRFAEGLVLRLSARFPASTDGVNGIPHDGDELFGPLEREKVTSAGALDAVAGTARLSRPTVIATPSKVSSTS